ncbi:MAG: DUF2007 domain-containing protein [Bacteroidia bacterium]|nr:DUF2007 domain-containing protein [Bacteroidia bacterium]
MSGWAIVAECPNGLWAALLRSYLEGAGIQVWLENEHMQHTLGAGLPSIVPANAALGPFRLWVPVPQTETALRLIEAFFSL